MQRFGKESFLVEVGIVEVLEERYQVKKQNSWLANETQKNEFLLGPLFLMLSSLSQTVFPLTAPYHTHIHVYSVF